jgi:hypothetical protein
LAFVFLSPVHGPGNSGAIRIAQCVLGIEIEKAESPISPPAVPSMFHFPWLLDHIQFSRFFLTRLLSPATRPRTGDPNAVSAGVIAIATGGAIVVIAASVWYFKYRKQQVLFPMFHSLGPHQARLDLRSKLHSATTIAPFAIL